MRATSSSNPEHRAKMTTARNGEVVNLPMLLGFIQPEIDKVGIAAFARQAGVDPRQIHAITRHEYLCRARLADRLLTLGMGRPDLVALVCVDVPA